MVVLEKDLVERFLASLVQLQVASKSHAFYVKWLRYYIEFCCKYGLKQGEAASLASFLDKLREKKQSDWQVKQASEAIGFYLKLSLQVSTDKAIKESASEACATLPCEEQRPEQGRKLIQVERVGRGEEPAREYSGSYDLRYQAKATPQAVNEASMAISVMEPGVVPQPRPSLATAADQASATGSSWVKEYARLSDEVKVRHLSPKTYRSYYHYVRKFQAFTKSLDPAQLNTEHVKAFLTAMAVHEKVAASTQNLAFNSLLFFYRHVLGKEFGKVDGVVRAKRRPYIPVVLSREEIEEILLHLEPPFDLVVKMLYGCGLRLFECLGLRVQCLNFAAGMLTVHDGKGKRDRTVPLPQAIVPLLKTQVAELKKLHQGDLANGYAGVFLVNALERKYPKAATAFTWQWLFPAMQLTREVGSGEMRRYHLHESHVSRALRRAADQAGLTKRVTSHTFRHSYASHLLQNNFDIRTIQELLGHGDVRTTMIYTHTIKSRTIKEAQSPLDF